MQQLHRRSGFHPSVWYNSSSEFASLYLNAIWAHTSGGSGGHKIWRLGIQKITWQLVNGFKFFWQPNGSYSTCIVPYMVYTIYSSCYRWSLRIFLRNSPLHELDRRQYFLFFLYTLIHICINTIYMYINKFFCQKFLGIQLNTNTHNCARHYKGA